MTTKSGASSSLSASTRSSCNVTSKTSSRYPATAAKPNAAKSESSTGRITALSASVSSARTIFTLVIQAREVHVTAHFASLILPIDCCHSSFRVARARDGFGSRDLVDAGEVFFGQLHIHSLHILFEILAPLCSGDGHDVSPLRHDPRE